MAVVNYNCPNCQAPLKFNPDKQLFSCEYCMSEFSEQQIQEIYRQREAHVSEEERRAEASEKKKTEGNPEASDEEAVVFTCPSCGAEIITTATTSATTCFYCRNPVVLGGRLSGEFKPDGIIPFKLSKDSAIEKFMEMCSKKHFLPKNFANKKRFEKMTGVYFPFWYIDSERFAQIEASGEKVRTWRVKNKRYTETSIYRLERAGDISVNNLPERALKGEDREMLRCVHPYDLKARVPFAMSYLSGFQAEKRDIEREELQQEVDERLKVCCRNILRGSINGYTDVQVKNYSDRSKSEKWSYALLPVWMANYKHGEKIYPFAINGQTGKTYGELPVARGKLWALGGIVAAAIMILGLLGGLILC